MLEENKQRNRVGISSYGNCGDGRLGKGMGKLSQIPAQPLIPQFAHDPPAPKPGFPECTAFISISNWLSVANIKPFFVTLQLKFEDFLIESTAMRELRRIREHVKYTMKTL